MLIPLGDTVETGGPPDIQNVPGGPGWDEERKLPKWHEYAGYLPGPDGKPVRHVPPPSSWDENDEFMAMVTADMCLSGPGVNGPATLQHEQLTDALFNAFVKDNNVIPKCFIPGLTDVPSLPQTEMFRRM